MPRVLDDVLRLQGSCTDARNEFGERAAAVLREAVVSGRGNIAHLPVLQINGCLVDVAPIAATDPGTAQRAIGAILQVCISTAAGFLRQNLACLLSQAVSGIAACPVSLHCFDQLWWLLISRSDRSYRLCQ